MSLWKRHLVYTRTTRRDCLTIKKNYLSTQTCVFILIDEKKIFGFDFTMTLKICVSEFFLIRQRQLLNFRVLEDRQRRNNGLSWDVKCWKCYQTPPRLNENELNLNLLFSIRWNMLSAEKYLHFPGSSQMYWPSSVTRWLSILLKGTKSTIPSSTLL